MGHAHPAATAGASAEERLRSRALHVLAEATAALSLPELQTVAAQVRRTLATPPPSPGQATLVATLAGGRTYGPEEQAALEFEMLLDYFVWRRELLAGALSAGQVARLLGVSRQTPHDRVKAGSLLAVMENGTLRFPPWQFDPAGPDGVLEGLPEVIRALAVPPLSKISWLVRPQPGLEGRTPLAALRAGERTRVRAEAFGVGAAA